MNIHILFCPARTIAADGGLLPTASLALSLDDEVQYRCAGFIQAEIELFSEDIGAELSPADDASDEGLTSEGENQETDDELKGRDGKVGKVAKGGARGKGRFLKLDVEGIHSSSLVELTSREGLEREYVFMEVMSTFLRAIRAGAIHPRHGAVLLAHYGRLGHAFDLCGKVVVDILREEGMCNNNGEVVVTAVTQAIQEVCFLPPCANRPIDVVIIISVIYPGVRRRGPGRNTFDSFIKTPPFMLCDQGSPTLGYSTS